MRLVLLIVYKAKKYKSIARYVKSHYILSTFR